MFNFVHSRLTNNFIKLGEVLICVMTFNIILFDNCNSTLTNEADSTLVVWDNKIFVHYSLLNTLPSSSIFRFLAANRRDGVVVRASASQSVDLGFIPLVESYQKTLKNGIYSFPAWRSAFMGGCGEQAGKFACCVLGQGT